MNATPRAPTLSLLLLDRADAKPPAGLERAVARGWALELIRATAPSFDRMAPAFAAALGASAGDYVFVLTPNTELSDEAWTAITAALAAEPGVEAFRLRLEGLPAERAWRGRRSQSHGRNLESVRFAHIVPPGALVVRRDLLGPALAAVSSDAGSDWWRLTTLEVIRSGRIVAVDAEARRRKLSPSEPACPSFAPTRGPAKVLVFGQIEVSTSLYFDFLEGQDEIDVAFRPLTRLSLDAPALAGADLVILVRELHRFWDEGVIAFLDAAGVPYVWFVDDNFQALRREGMASGFYAQPRMRTALRQAAAIWTSTPALAAAHVWLHPRVETWGPALDPALWAPPPPSPATLTVAIPAGDFRVAGLAGGLTETLRALSEARPLRVLATPAGAVKLRPALPRAQVLSAPHERSFRQHIRQWRHFAPDIVLHPLGETANAPFKAPTAAIVAGYHGAVPVVGDEPAYDTWSESEGVLRLADLEMAAAQARDAGWRADMAGRLGAALAARLGPEGRVWRLEAMARRPVRRKLEAVVANVLESPEFNRGRLALSAARLTRRLRDRLRPPG